MKAAWRQSKFFIRDALLLFTILPFDKKSSTEAAKVYRELSVKGKLIGIRDIRPLRALTECNSLREIFTNSNG